jgi:hypothetical protein
LEVHQITFKGIITTPQKILHLFQDLLVNAVKGSDCFSSCDSVADVSRTEVHLVLSVVLGCGFFEVKSTLGKLKDVFCQAQAKC